MQTDIDLLKKEEKEKSGTDWTAILELDKKQGGVNAGTQPTPTNPIETTNPWNYLLIISLVVLGMFILFRTGYGLRSIWAWWWVIFLIKPFWHWLNGRHRGRC